MARCEQQIAKCIRIKNSAIARKLASNESNNYSIIRAVLQNIQDVTMRLGIAFPIVIFIIAVIFLAWFFIGGYALPGGAQ